MSKLKLKSKANVLVVDDLRVNLFLIKSILKKLDVNLIIAESGIEALSKIKDKKIALALLDIHMSKMDGVKLAEEIQKVREERVPIIFITAYLKDEVELENYYKIGAVDFIYKPFRKNILCSKVEVFLELFQQRQKIEEQKNEIQNHVIELEKVNQSLNKRLAYESILSEISEMAVTVNDLGQFSSAVLSVIGDSLDLSRTYIFEYSDATNTIRNTDVWCKKGVSSNKEFLQGVSCTLLSFLMEILKRDKIFNYSNIEDIPDKNTVEFLRGQNVLSILAIPLFVRGNFFGFISFCDFTKQREWTIQDIEFLSSISRIIVAVTERNQAEEKLKQTRLLLKSSLESPKDIMIVSIDRNYRYLFFNEAHKISMKNAYNYDIETGMNILECVTTEKDRHNAKVNFDIALSGKELVTIQDFGYIQRVTYENSYNPVRNDNNEIVGVTLFTRDITQRILAEKELKNSMEELHKLTQHVQKVREEERVAIARELHDDLGQSLTAVKIDLGIIRLSTSDKSIVQKIIKLSELVSETIKTVQKITFQLRPAIIDDLGLEAGIEWYTSEFSERNGIEINLDLKPDIVISPEISLVIFRIMQESLTNVSRHAKASKIDILLNENDNCINFVVTDNGIGISETQLNSKKSFGIIGMKERANSVGGKLTIVKNNEGGTSLQLTFPLLNKGV